MSSFHLPTAISNAMTLIRERAQRHGIRLGAQIDQRLGEFQADERKVKQILLNLLSNAVKFTPHGGRVGVDIERREGAIEISVTDTGQGIAAEFLPHVFDRFRQAERVANRRHTGLGLGLAISLLLAHMYLESRTTALVNGLEMATMKFLNSVAERRVEPQRALTPGQVAAQLGTQAGHAPRAAHRA